jgi:hypothetical protein
MTELVATCAMLMWTAATGPVTQYDLYENNVYTQTVTETEARICQSVPIFIPHEIYVVALNVAGESGEPSNPLFVQWVPDADLDNDGAVGMTDFGLFTQSFGKCDDGTKRVPCG